MRCINFLEKPSSGSVIFDGRDLGSLSEKELRQVRQQMGMIFQQFNLLMQRTALENVCFPLEIAGVKKDEAQKRALELWRSWGSRNGRMPIRCSFRRSEATRGDCPRAGDESEGAPLRRGNFGA